MEHQSESTRQQKVSRLLQKELGTHFMRESITLCGGKMVTVTNVRVTPDFGLARVHLSVFPSENSKDTLELVKLHVKSIRYYLASQIKKQLRVVPELEFYIDDSLDYIEKIDKLLKK